MKLKRVKPSTLLVMFGMLYLLKIALGQAGLAAEGIEGTPAWMAPTLLALSNLAGAGLILFLAVIAIVYGRDIYAWFQSLLDGDDQDASESPQGEKPQTQAITRDLYLTVVGLERHGAESGELVELAASQTLALIEICKQLQRRAVEYAEITHSLTEALKAVTSGNPLKIKEAAGAVRDQHISNLMLLSTKETDADYWESVSSMIASQLGAARRWQSEYRKMAGALIGEVSGIKVRLTAITAHVEVAEAARPLLQAKVSLENAGRILRAPIHEAASPSRLFAPQNEYQLPRGGNT